MKPWSTSQSRWKTMTGAEPILHFFHQTLCHVRIIDPGRRNLGREYRIAEVLYYQKKGNTWCGGTTINYRKYSYKGDVPTHMRRRVRWNNAGFNRFSIWLFFTPIQYLLGWDLFFWESAQRDGRVLIDLLYNQNKGKISCCGTPMITPRPNRRQVDMEERDDTETTIKLSSKMSASTNNRLIKENGTESLRINSTILNFPFKNEITTKFPHHHCTGRH